MKADAHIGGVVSAGILLGAGLGGFFDGIVLHQILQWHSMFSSVVPPTDLVAMKYNMLWDGVFHAITWLMTVTGLGLLWRATPRSEVPWPTSILVGALSLGWGCFNAVEGFIDHQLLGIHHVHPGRNEFAWDVGFLLSGIILCAVGTALIQRGRRTLRSRTIKQRKPYLHLTA